MTAVEFALIGPTLMLFLMGAAELGLMAGAQNVLDNAAFVASRAGKTGYTESNKTQDQMIRAAVTKSAANYLKPASLVITSEAYGSFREVGQPEPYTDTNKNGQRDANEPFTDLNGNGSWDADYKAGKSGTGTTSQIVAYTLTYNWQLFTPLLGRVLGSGGVVPLKARLVVRNEPY